MRTTIVVLVAIALVSPSANLAAAPSETNDSASTQTQHADNILRKTAKPRKYARRRQAKSRPTLKHREVAKGPRPTDAPESGRQTSRVPPCSSNPNADHRCLHLTELAPQPISQSGQKFTGYVPLAPFAAPSRSWLGAFSKRILTEIVQMAEVLFADGDGWRTITAMQVQSELEQARLKQQQRPKQ